ncbi:AT-hook motif nuclear-localized protein 1-like [Pyrus communis]|uniref:AT-hook motif nuclear-localized protein 1-like n=1 Tax=Pyrus communis TaxID=23211 RepID=UPI0035BF3469
MASEGQGTIEIPSGLPTAAMEQMFESPVGYQAFPNSIQAGTSPAMAPPPASGGANGASTSGKKKRGRPRKYDPYGTAPAAKKPSSPDGTVPPASGKCSSEQKGKAPMAEPIGEEWGSIETTLNNFTPYMITVNSGEDVAWKIAQTAQQNTGRGIIIMSATGMLKEVTLINPAHGISPIKQEGQFNIIQISGSFMMYDKKGTCSGGMSITLADSDGRSVEGSVGGSLIAATPVQMRLLWILHVPTHHTNCIRNFGLNQSQID